MSTHPVQQDGDCALWVKSSLFTSELRNLSHEHDYFANKIVKIGILSHILAFRKKLIIIVIRKKNVWENLDL